MAEQIGEHRIGIVPVILCGGSGTRLWPVSRKSFPKQFWPLTSARTMLQETAVRAAGQNFAAPVVIANETQRFIVAEQLREHNDVKGRILLEPESRNSGPAIAAAALFAAETNPNAVLWILPADAAITDHTALLKTLTTAADVAHTGLIATFGMNPTAPETGYGYIERGDALSMIDDAFHVARFIEKPDAEIARRLIADSRHYWNSGMFVARASTLLDEFGRYAPDVITAVTAAFGQRTHDLDFVRLGADAFCASPNVSFDYAIAEKTDRAAVIPASLGWSDVGSWSSVWEIAPKDPNGNVVVGDAIIEDLSNCYVRSEGIVTAVLGIDDTVVVSTQDAVLVTRRDRSQDVKLIVERVRQLGRSEADTHARVYRPWGFYETLVGGDRFQVKRIVVHPGARLSLQKHFHRAEHWVVVGGSALVTRDSEVRLIHENESIYLPVGCIHRLHNPGKIPLTLIEVQSGAYLGEDDIVRLEDHYGRS